jgi:hypothetical protein
MFKENSMFHGLLKRERLAHFYAGIFACLSQKAQPMRYKSEQKTKLRQKITAYLFANNSISSTDGSLRARTRPETGRWRLLVFLTFDKTNNSRQFERPPGAKTEHGREKRHRDARKRWL